MPTNLRNQLPVALIAIVTGLLTLTCATAVNAQDPSLIINPRNFSLNTTKFSARLAISSNLIAVGQAIDQGIIHIFSIQSNSVTKLNTITSPDTAYDAPTFGNSLGLVRDVLYAGSQNTYRAGAHDGTAYLFKNVNGNPTLVSKWTELPSQWAGYFGARGCLVGDSLVVSQGASPQYGSKGGAFFYRVDAVGNRTSVFSFMAPDSDRSVDGLALSSNRCAVVWYSRANTNNCQILVFDIQRNATNGFSGIKTNAVITATNYLYGSWLSTGCDGDLVGVGEPQLAVGTNKCGRVRLWRVGNGTSTLIATLTPPDLYHGGNYGECVFVKNNTLFVGSPTVPGASNAQGCVYIYSIPTTGAPVLIKKLQPSSPAIGSGEYFGNPIVWDGTRVIIGSSGGNNRTGSGVVYIYDADSLVNVGPLPPRIAQATATLANGFVVGVNLTDGGYGYTNTPAVRMIGGGGSGAQAVAAVSNGVVVALNVLNAGYGYTNAPVVVIQPPFIPNPSLGIAPLTLLSFSNLTVSGSYQLQRQEGWYWTNEPASFTASTSTYTQMVAGAPGSKNYRLALSPAPAQAFATAQVVNGFVVGATLTAGGSGYFTAPAVAFVGESGSNATAEASVSAGAVTSITITGAGIGYTNTPTVQIDAPPAATVSPSLIPVMRVDAANLSPYDNYQLQFKPSLNAEWENWTDGWFSPTEAVNSQFLFISNNVGFFRLQYLP